MVQSTATNSILPALASVLLLSSSALVGQASPSRANRVLLDDQPTTAQKSALLAAARRTPYREDLVQDWSRIALRVGEADLNDDGIKDLLAYFGGHSGFCGSHGCDSAALLGARSGYTGTLIALALHGDTTTGNVLVRPEKHNGMHDLSYDDSKHVFRWNGKKYE